MFINTLITDYLIFSLALHIIHTERSETIRGELVSEQSYLGQNLFNMSFYLIHPAMPEGSGNMLD